MEYWVKACLIVCAGGLLGACGQKGPLVLPDAVQRKHPIPSFPSTAPAKPNGAGNASPGTPTPAAPGATGTTGGAGTSATGATGGAGTSATGTAGAPAPAATTPPL